MRKGFTLVELLAVMVILAIISLIATPALTKVVSNAKKSASIESARGYVDAIDTQIVSNGLSLRKHAIIDGTYNIDDLEIDTNEGKKPENGIVIINKGHVKNARLCIGKYSVDFDGKNYTDSSNDYCGKNKVTLVSNGKEITNTSKGGNSYTVDLKGITNINCNNGAIPEVSGNTLTVKNTIGNTTCELSSSLKDTFSHLNKGDNNIIMVNDENIDYQLTLNKDMKVNLNLSNSTINFTKAGYTFLFVKGDMLISADKEGTIKSVNKMIRVESTGNLHIKGGNYIASDETAPADAINMIISFGRMTIDDGYFDSPSLWTVGSTTKDGLIVINGGEISSKKSFALVSGTNSKIIINNAKVYTDSSVNGTISATSTGGNIIINDGEFYTNANGRIAYSAGNNSYLTINGGYFHSNSDYSPVTSWNGGHLTINDGYFENKGSKAIGIANNTEPLYINGGTFVSYKYSALEANEGTTINITDKKNKVYIASLFYDESLPWTNTAVVSHSGGNINIKGHAALECNENIGINKSGICIYSTRRTVLDEVASKGTINIDGANIVSKNKFAISTYDGIINVKNSIITSGDKAIGLVLNDNSIDQTKAVVNICNSTISGKVNNIYADKNTGYVKYNSSVKFDKKITDLNNPSHVVLDNKITCN